MFDVSVLGDLSGDEPATYTVTEIAVSVNGTLFLTLTDGRTFGLPDGQWDSFEVVSR